MIPYCLPQGVLGLAFGILSRAQGSARQQLLLLCLPALGTPHALPPISPSTFHSLCLHTQVCAASPV